MLLIDGLLYSQDVKTFEFEKVVKYVDSLLCNNEIVWYGPDTVVFDTKNRDIYIYKDIEKTVFFRDDTIKLKDTVVKEEWISNLCIGKALLINSEQEIKDKLKDKLLISFYNTIISDSSSQCLEVWISIDGYIETIRDWGHLYENNVRILLYIEDNTIVKYKCQSWST